MLTLDIKAITILANQTSAFKQIDMFVIGSSLSVLNYRVVPEAAIRLEVNSSLVIC